MSPRPRCPWRRPWPTRPNAAATSTPSPRCWTNAFSREPQASAVTPHRARLRLAAKRTKRPTMSLTECTAAELLDLLARGETTAEVLTAEFLQAIRTRDPLVRAFLHVDEAGALEQARAVDAKR